MCECFFFLAVQNDVCKKVFRVQEKNCHKHLWNKKLLFSLGKIVEENLWKHAWNIKKNKVRHGARVGYSHIRIGKHSIYCSKDPLHLKQCYLICHIQSKWRLISYRFTNVYRLTSSEEKVEMWMKVEILFKQRR